MHPNLRPGEDFQHFLDRQAREMQEKAAALTEAFADSAATVSSRDGSVTVTVAPNGALRNLQLGHRACELGPARLTTAIMDTVRLAQKQTAHSVAQSFTTVTGESEAADLIRTFLPPQDETGDDAEQNKFVEEPEPEPAPPPPPAPPVGQAKPAPRRRQGRDDADDEVSPW